MIIEEIKPNGFCGGVKNAIKIINNNLHTFKKPVYMLGFLIHNKNIVEAFKNKGIIICTVSCNYYCSSINIINFF